MKIAIIASISLLGIALIPSSTQAALPQIRATCPTGILVSGGGNNVFINGQPAVVTMHGANGFSAKSGGISVDYVFVDGEPSLSYTGPRRANGMCTITKFTPPVAAPSRPAGGPDLNRMALECKGFASEKFGVRPSYVSVHPAMRDHGMYSVYGNADDRNFICTFNAQGTFIAVDPTSNPDGDL